MSIQAEDAPRSDFAPRPGDRDRFQQIRVTLPGMQRDDVYAESVSGREALGEAYAFTVDVISRDPLSLERMLGKAAKLEIGVFDEEAVVRGVIAAAETRDPTQTRENCYRFTIVPELAMLRYSGQNQVYGTDRDVTVVDIIEGELSDANKSSSNTASDRVARAIQYEILAEKGDYPKLDFVLQYRESDFDFISRLCERFGIFYAFDHGGEKEKVLFCDRKEHFRKLGGRTLGDELSYGGSEQIRRQGDFGIRSFNAVYSVQSGTVRLREYNDETPNVDLTVSASASYPGQGVRVDYGQNYRTVPEGEFLARRRTGRLENERLKYRGESNIPLIRPGLFFRLKDHPLDELDGTYVVTEVEHRITEQVAFGFSSTDRPREHYTNRFTCVPFDAGFTPAIKTPKPVVHGYLIATIDGDRDGAHAQLDEYGRYHVCILDDESALAEGKASHLVRKAEPYGGGDGEGSHSTLLVGTEVVLGFLHGDPDRPIILGALSNAENSNPVSDANNNVSMRLKASGTIFQICQAAS